VPRFVALETQVTLFGALGSAFDGGLHNDATSFPVGVVHAFDGTLGFLVTFEFAEGLLLVHAGRHDLAEFAEFL